MRDREYMREKKRLPKWKGLALAKNEFKDKMVAKIEENNAKKLPKR